MTVSVKSSALLSSSLTTTFSAGLFFRFLICNKKRPKCSLPYDIMANFLFPGKPRQITKPIYFFFSFTRKSQGKLKFNHVDLTSTWVGKGRVLPAALMSLIFHGFPTIWNTFGRIYSNQIQFGFHTFLYPLEIHFPGCFSFCVCENGTFFQWNWSLLLYISRSISFPVIQVNVDIKIS